MAVGNVVATTVTTNGDDTMIAKIGEDGIKTPTANKERDSTQACTTMIPKQGNPAAVAVADAYPAIEAPHPAAA